MTANDNLKSSSYRGVQFFYQSSRETGGFKTATHIYPGSDNFQVEQLGKTPRVFNIIGKVNVDNRDSFDAALNTPGKGVFSHPLYGNFIVKVTQFTKDDNKDDLGLYTYKIEFMVEIGLIVPSVSTISTSLISRARATYISTASTLLKDTLTKVGF